MKKIAALILIAFSMISASAQTAKEMRDNFIAAAKSYLGVPYVYGGRSTSGMDCSGFVYCSGVKGGIASRVAESSRALYEKASKIEDSEREAGDLVFFSANGSSVSHVGIYLGANRMIHSASDGSKTGVITSYLSENYWRLHYFGAGRIIPSAKTQAAVALKKKKAAANFAFDTTVFADWSFFDADSVQFYMKGISVQAELRTQCWKYNPGIFVRYSYLNREGNPFLFGDTSFVNEVPVCLEFNFNNYIAVYTGAVLSTGITCKDNALLHGSNKEIAAGIYPGIFGAVFRTPQVSCGAVNLSLVQDISWSYFKACSGSSDLSFMEGFAAGMTFSTGLRITLPF